MICVMTTLSSQLARGHLQVATDDGVKPESRVFSSLRSGIVLQEAGNRVHLQSPRCPADRDVDATGRIGSQHPCFFAATVPRGDLVQGL